MVAVTVAASMVMAAADAVAESAASDTQRAAKFAILGRCFFRTVARSRIVTPK